MFYRRKLVFALLEKIEGDLERTRIQKLIFLLTQKQAKSSYDFVPYKFGCYSYSLKADLNAMIKREWLIDNENHYTLLTKKKYYDELTLIDKKIVNETVELYGEMRTDIITKHTYLNHPYYAINSIIAKDILPKKYYDRIINSKPKNTDTVLFTIGYEGISLEEYLNRLIKNDIKLLVDVRRNPLSQKYGFSKKLLKGFCEKLNINYLHIPEVGIDSSKRRSLNTQDDYDLLFDDYKQTILNETTDSQNLILKLLKDHKRIALTCFESDICQCHRTHLAEKIKNSPTFRYELQHI
ncbi:DUF488 domain-containing protein [Dokdonia sp.]|uniref:DUF488 domain-containing protein n=1 Tax=Dokdonia sp. TaxID=2024995 RepID=UPI003267B997